MKNLKFTLKAWPVITLVIIGLCFLTKLIAEKLGINLPDQSHLETFRAYAGWNRTFISLCFQVLVVAPILEEAYFRFCWFALPQESLERKSLLMALLPTALFVALGLAFQAGCFGDVSRFYVMWKLPSPAGLWFWSILLGFASLEYIVRVLAGRGIALISPYAITIASALLFSAAHYIQQPFPDAAFLALFFFGLAQCWLYRKTGNIWCAMVNHGLFNATNLILLFVLPESCLK